MTGKHIAPEVREAIAQERQRGATYADLERKYGCCCDTVARALREYGLVRPPHRTVRRRTSREQAHMREHVEDGPYGLYLRYLPE